MENANTKNLQNNYLRPPPISQSHPWLIFCHGKNKQRQTFFSVSEGRYYVKVIPDMRNKIICCSGKGWLLLKDLDSQDCFFINLRTMEKIQLPQISLKIISCIPSWLPPTNNNSCLFVFCEGNFLLMWLNGDTEFEVKDIELEDEGDLLGEVILFNGAIYGLTYYGMKLVMADNYVGSSMQFRNSIIKESLESIRRSSLCYITYMFQSCNELMVLNQIDSHPCVTCTRALCFEIFRANFTKGTWEEVNNIGNRTIFLSSFSNEDTNKCCFITENEIGSGIKSNSIYFSKRRHLYVYDLEDRSISISLPCPIVSGRHSFQCWVEF